jgi:phage-related baseplate assembly protein
MSVSSPRPDDIRALVLQVLAAHGAGAELVAAMTAALDGATWPGTVLISLLSSLGDGTASDAEIEAVEMAVAENEVRPLTDWPRCLRPRSCPTIDIDLTVYAGPDEAVVLTAAQQAVDAYREARASWAARSPAPGCSARRWSAGFTTR